MFWGVRPHPNFRETLKRMEQVYNLMISRARILLIAILLSFPVIAHITTAEAPPAHNSLITDMIQKIDENAIYSTVYSLQNFRTRSYGYAGNTEAATWLYNQFNDIPGLTVDYQGGDYRNVIATLPGLDTTSSSMYIIGAHYDSRNSADPSYAPGATDNGGGVAIVLELARIMSQYAFNHTIQFALWNTEEAGASAKGSNIFTDEAKANNLNISLYINFDSSCYDPDNYFILDIMYNDQSQWVSDMMTQHNSLYNIGFKLTYNVHLKCGSDHNSFWDHGYTAVMTHEETHGPAHTQYDTIDKVSTLYAKKNGQIGLSIIATLAEVQAPIDFELDTIPPIADAGVNQTISEGALVTFDGSGSTDNLGIAEYQWSFVDTTPRTLIGIVQTYTFSSAGNYTVVLNVTDFAGNSATDTVIINVSTDTTNPIAYSGVDQTGDVNTILTFDASGSSDDVGIVNYEWDFGDGTTGVGKTVTHIYRATGTFPVILTVKDASGNIGTESLQVEIRSSQFRFDSNLSIGIIAVVLGLIILGIILFLKRRF